ncbi:MAG: hypothetical protein AAB368_10135, partial [bacterium]
MEYELIIPAHMSVEAVVDQVARAAWSVLASNRLTWGLYQGYFVTVYDAVHQHLERSFCGEES